MNRVLVTAMIVAVAFGFVTEGAQAGEKAPKVKSFCEYGTAVALQLGAGGAIWEQDWGQQPNAWYACGAEPSVGILSNDAVGLLQTTTAGQFIIDENLVLHLPFAGETALGGGLLLTEYDEDGGIAGEMLLEVHEGMFIVDLNAANALVDDEAGTITLNFGEVVIPGVNAYATIVEKTGKFKTIQQVEPWELSVSGQIVIALAPALPLQSNILAALLPNSPLLLAAEEEIVLNGNYYRASPQE